MVELNEKALEAAHHAYQTHGQMGHLKAQRLSDSCLTAVITAYLAALPASDHPFPSYRFDGAKEVPSHTSNSSAPASDHAGLVERLRKSADGLAQRQSEWVEHALAIPADGEALEATSLLREAATAIQSKDEQIAFWKARAEQFQRERAELHDRLNGTPCAEVRFRQELEAAEELREKMAADWFNFCETMGVTPDTQEAVAYELQARLSNADHDKRAAEQQVQKLTAENERLREALEVSRQVLAKLLSAGHNNPPATPEEIDAAFWSVDAALTQEGER